MHKLVATLVFLVTVPLSVSASTLYINPSEGTYGPGDTFIAELRINPDGDCINAADITVVYPHDSLKAVDFSKGESILSLFVTEPRIDDTNGVVTFSGGVPGGYCGRIPGDPAISNILGKIVFSVLQTTAKKAVVTFSDTSTLYANDGSGTKITPKSSAATFALTPQAQLSRNVWLDQVKSDTIPPDPFVVDVESTRGVFAGKYYIVFSTLDKQSGLDHYEIYERGGWQPVSSPHELQRQTFLDNLQVRAIDKAGNMRIGTFVATSLPPSQAESDLTPLYICIVLFVLAIAIKIFLDRRKNHDVQSQ